ncbi:hypothetical protein [Rhodoferax sp.]|uniref:hypothetical protein n=1 Tax=Rhodoferax sp. TaxID=50421 RepID=UPI002617FBCD|nr:hypothetical protein [Rhodoferax sp.]MDD2926545.1 hypothetical protein [Rhodoferax sp.]
MKRRHLYTLVAAATLVLSLPALAAGNSGGNGGAGGGNSGSRGGGNDGSGNQGNANAGAPPEAGTKGKSSQTGKSTKAGKTVAQQLTDRKQLSTQLGQLLPAGTDLQAAAAGFKNLGQFVAAVHVSNNLGIPFTDLKTRMMAGASLGTSIRALRPEVNATAEATKAQRQAKQDLAANR